MKSCLLLIAVAMAAAQEQPLRFYHERFGIPGAERIRQREERQSNNRIAGGEAIDAGRQPHLGGLLITLLDGRTSMCGSSMLSHTKALTAAHCWSDGQVRGRRITVVYGSARLFRGGTRVTTDDVQLHDGYNARTLNNDIAIITHESVGYSNTIRAIQLPSGSQENENFAEQTATAAGYGRTAENTAVGPNQGSRQVSVPVITNAQCQRVYGGTTVVASTLCTSGAGGRSVCPGDSGGPLSVGEGDNRILIGVTSFVASAGCQRGFPAGFARVTAFLPWIREGL